MIEKKYAQYYLNCFSIPDYQVELGLELGVELGFEVGVGLEL